MEAVGGGKNPEQWAKMTRGQNPAAWISMGAIHAFFAGHF